MDALFESARERDESICGEQKAKKDDKRRESVQGELALCGAFSV